MGDTLTPDEAARLAGVTTDAIRKAITLGKLPARRESPRKTRIDRADVDRYKLDRAERRQRAVKRQAVEDVRATMASLPPDVQRELTLEFARAGYITDQEKTDAVTHALRASAEAALREFQSDSLNDYMRQIGLELPKERPAQQEDSTQQEGGQDVGNP